LRPSSLTNSIRILECLVTESDKVYSRKNQVSGYGLSPISLDKKTHVMLELYSKVFAKRHPSKRHKKLEWDEILKYLNEQQKNNKISLEIPLEKFSPDSLKKWFLQNSKRFKQRPRLTSRFFRKHKDQLLKERLMVQLRSSDKRTKYYSITPLGICFLVKNRGYGLHGELPKKILKILYLFCDQTIIKNAKIFGTKKFDFHDIDKKLFATETNYRVTKLINELLYHWVEYSKSPFGDNTYYVSVKYPVSFNLENIIARFVLRDNEIKYFENFVVKEDPIPIPTDYMDEKTFHAYLSMFLLYGICYYTIKSHFDDFISARKSIGVDDFKFSDYDYELDKIKKYDKKLLELVILLNEYFSKLLSDENEIKTQLEFFRNKIQQYEEGKEPINKIYKHDPDSLFFRETPLDAINHNEQNNESHQKTLPKSRINHSRIQDNAPPYCVFGHTPFFRKF